jgi:cytochrome c oxidase subunit 4
MSDHVVPVRTYVAVFLALIVLTGATVAAAKVDLGEPEVGGLRLPLNVIVAVAIAVLKAVLVVLFFMHVKYSGRLVQLVVGAAFAFLGLLLAITFSDYLSRDWLPAPGRTTT